MTSDPPVWQFWSSPYRNDRSATGSSSSHVGEVTAFIPLSAPAGYVGDPLPEGPVPVAVHHGPLRELDRTYAAPGGFVA
jgi:hypothetical protein